MTRTRGGQLPRVRVGENVDTLLTGKGVFTIFYLYLDHDTPGRELAAYLKAQLSELEVLDRSDLYTGYKDFNEYLQAMQTRARDG